MIHYEQYNSIQAFAQRLMLPDNENFKIEGEEHYNRKKSSRKNFNQFNTFAEAVEALTTGDAENAAKIKKAFEAQRCNAGKVEKIRQTIRTSGGGVPNIPAFLSGSARHMMQRVKRQQRTNILDVYINGTCDYKQKAADILTVNISILQAVQAVERAGYQCNIYVCNIVKNTNGNLYAYSVRIKPAGAPLNVYNVAFPMLSPDMLRRVTFKYLCSAEGFKHSGMGYVVSDEKKQREALRIASGTPLFCMQNCLHDVYMSNEARTKKYINTILATN